MREGTVRASRRQPPLRVFISSAYADVVFARKLRNLLFHGTNAQVFTTEELSAGEKWAAKLRNELTAADIVLAVLSPESVHDSWVLHEVGAAWALQKPIIPVVTRRDVLNNMPVPLAGASVIEVADVETPENERRFLDAFDALKDSLIAAHSA